MADPKLPPGFTEIPPGFEEVPNTMAPPSGFSDTKPTMKEEYGERTPTPYERFGAKVKKAAGELYEGAKGVGRYMSSTGEFTPEIDPQTGKPYPEVLGNIPALKVQNFALLMAAESDPDKRAKLIMKNFPGWKSYELRGDNLYMKHENGKTYVFDRKGFSSQNAVDVASIIGEIALLGKGAVGKSIVGTGVRGGALEFAAQTGKDVTSNLAGSGRKIGISETGRRAGIAGIAGALGGAAGDALFRTLSTLTRMGGVVHKGKITPAARKVLARAGVDPKTMTPEDLTRLEFAMRNGSTPDEAANFLLAKEFDFPTTRAFITGRTKDVRTEEYITRSGLGEDTPLARALINRLGKEQPEALNRAKGNVTQDITGRPPIESRGEAFGPARADMAARYRAARKEVNAAYTRARDLDASVDPVEVRKWATSLRRSLVERDGYDRADIAPLLRQLRQLAAAARRAAKRGEAIPLKRLESLRQKLGNLGSPVNSPKLFSAAKKAKARQDAWEDGLADKGGIIGSPEAQTAFKEARALSRKMKATFQDNPTVAKVLETRDAVNPDSGAVTREFTLDPSEAVDKIMGAGVGKQGTAPTIRAVRAALGKNNPQWQGIRSEMMARMFDGNKPFDSLWASLKRDRREVLSALFNKQEMAKLERLAKLANRARTYKGKSVNTSDSGWTLISAASATGVHGPIDFLRYYLSKPLKKGQIEVMSRGALGPRIPRAVPPVFPGFSGVLGNIGAQKSYGDE